MFYDDAREDFSLTGSGMSDFSAEDDFDSYEDDDDFEVEDEYEDGFDELLEEDDVDFLEESFDDIEAEDGYRPYRYDDTDVSEYDKVDPDDYE